jgi:hypothetical protein
VAVSLYRLVARPALRDPVVLVAFDAWVDAGSASTRAAALVAEGAKVVATLDGDALFDYRARRPTLRIENGRPRELEWPELTIRRARLAPCDVLVMAGPEPDYRWRALASELVELANELDVRQWISLGSIPAAVPHTRPVPVLGTASAEGLLRGDVEAGPAGLLQVPAAAISVLDMAASAAGIPTVGYFAQVPHYVSGEYPAAAVALVRALERHLDVELTTAVLELEARGIRTRLDAAAAADDTTKAYIDRLERMVDESRLPSGDELIGEIERFLRDRGSQRGPIH